MVEGESGLLATHPKDQRPIYEPSKRRVTWPNGAVATLFNATEPDQLRGPQHDLAWLDELAKWRYAQETFDMLQFGLRLGDKPRQCVTTTPRPTPLVRYLMKQPRWVVTKGSTYDNQANLAPSFVKQIISRYEGTRLGRQELNAEVLDDAPGALWTRAKLDETRRRKTDKLPDMQRIVVAIDPAASAGTEDGQAETGIVVAGMGVDGRGYVLDDVSCRATPNAWARQAVAAYDLYSADAIVAETNQGGDMVEQTIRSVRPSIPFIGVRASRGKVTRAEPVAALYEQGRVSHVGSFPQLEDQMVLFTPLGIEGGTTADRTDALVWALTELFPSMVHRRAWDEDEPDDRRYGANRVTGY
jgi:phage terminase large subunit-like protein